ncbi:UNVERIFIED_CONTAM: hypothetical protein FKN15_048801 [Acipenser sinensis]
MIVMPLRPKKKKLKMDIEELIRTLEKSTAETQEATHKQQWRQEWGLPTRELECPVSQLGLVLRKVVWPAPQQELPTPAPERELLSLEPELPAPELEPVVPELQQELQLSEGEELLPSPETPVAIEGEEVPQPPTLQVSPALPREVPGPIIVDTWSECPDLPTLDLAPRSQLCQAQLPAWSLAPLP